MLFFLGGNEHWLRTLDLVLRLLKLNLTLAHIWVYVKSSLGVKRNVLPRFCDLIRVKFPVNGRLLFICLNLHLSHWVRDKTVAISRVTCFGAGGTAQSYVELVVCSTSSSQQLP